MALNTLRDRLNRIEKYLVWDVIEVFRFIDETLKSCRETHHNGFLSCLEPLTLLTQDGGTWVKSGCEADFERSSASLSERIKLEVTSLDGVEPLWRRTVFHYVTQVGCTFEWTQFFF